MTWKIHVTAKNKKCYANRKVKWFRNGVFKHNKHARMPRASSSSRRRCTTPSTYQAKLPKKEFGMHPHHHSASKSHSKAIKIVVKPKH